MPTERVFVSDDFTIQLRSARALRWPGAQGTGYAVLFLLGGTLSWRDEGTAPTNQESNAPAALLVAPGESLEARASRAETVSLSLSPAYLLDCALRARLTRDDAQITFKHAATDDPRLAALAREIAEELRGAETGQEMVVSALVEQIVVRLLRRHANVRRSDELELSRVGLVDRRVRRAVELMHAHLDRELPLEELAAAAYLSPFHFARLFKKVTGASPHAYLAALRIERAKSLLATTDLSVTEITQRVGYATSSHFAKAFRQSTGLTPRSFRSALVPH
ncbi:MAG: AraC family transcriptional regulator [Acidobacteriota bacterium]|nr:AraC family transcriptional regulator [Acidobacteriota bacterium]